MASRRTFLKLSVGAYAAGACGAGVVIRSDRGRVPDPPYKVVFDERYEEPRAFGAGAAARGIATAAIRADVTRLFFDDLDVRWKQGPVLLAGYTTRVSLFCLDLLARDRGMRLTHCMERPKIEDAWRALEGSLRWPTGSLSSRSDLVFWIIAPNNR